MPSSNITSLLVKGCISDPLYHRACKMTTILVDASILANESPEAMLETEYQEYLTAKKGQIAGDIFEHKAKHIVLEDGGGRYFGGVEELIRLAERKMTPAFDRTEDDETDWTSIARRECEQYLRRKQCSLVYMDITLDPLTPPQRVIFQLFNQVCPKTSENFRALCTGERGKSLSGYRLSYEGTPFHRVVRGGWVQGGDIVSGDGDGGASIYGADFADENFSVNLNRAGVLAMANDGPHTNSSQFLVTLSSQQWLNYGVVAFGRVIMGLKTFRQMSELDTLNQRPITECKVNKCGELTPAEYAAFTCK